MAACVCASSTQWPDEQGTLTIHPPQMKKLRPREVLSRPQVVEMMNGRATSAPRVVWPPSLCHSHHASLVTCTLYPRLQSLASQIQAHQECLGTIQLSGPAPRESDSEGWGEALESVSQVPPPPGNSDATGPGTPLRETLLLVQSCCWPLAGSHSAPSQLSRVRS